MKLVYAVAGDFKSKSSFFFPPSGTVAHKIMQKYGFREGQGLGKHEQGLSTALSVEKTSKRGGKIIVGDATEKDASKKSDSNPLTEILKCPTKVVLLRVRSRIETSFPTLIFACVSTPGCLCVLSALLIR